MKIGSARPDFDVGVVTNATVEPGKEYSFSGWLLCEKERGQNPDAFITVGHDPSGQTVEAIKTVSLVWSPNLETEKPMVGKWTRFERVFRATSASVSLWVRCGNRQGVSPFFVRIDDVALRQVKRERD